MTPSESVGFEGDMRGDGFLSDAVEGFKTDPEAFDDMPQLSRPSFSWMYVLGALSIALLFAWLPNEPESSYTPSLVAPTAEKPQVLEPKMDLEQAQIIEVEKELVHAKSETVASLVDFETPKSNTKEMKPHVFIEAYMRPIEAGEIASYTPKKLLDNTKIIYVQDLKIVRLSADGGNAPQNSIEHDSHLPASHETSVPISSKLEARLAERVNKKSYIKELEIALLDFQQENYDEALGKIKLLDKIYGENINQTFYAALCLYHMDFFDKAFELFSQVENDVIQSFRPEAIWYQALSLQAMGESEKAQRYFTEIYNNDGHYAPMAASRLIGLQ